MKKLYCILILAFMFVLGGCDAQKPDIIMSSRLITTESIYNLEQRFQIGQRINYAVVSPKGFKDDVLRVQILKKDQLVGPGGIQVVSAKSVTVDVGMKYYVDYFVMQNSGYYIMRVFEVRDLENAIAIYDFHVQ